MDQDGMSRLKTAIRDNFNQSPDRYERFEQEHGFFHELNRVLLTEMNVADGSIVLDVGCGTGASSRQIAGSVRNCTVWGLDISPSMLEAAKINASDPVRFHFVEGDAARLAEYFETQFDAIVYSASIFLVPDFRQSLLQACDLLKDRGTLGLTFMDGVFTSGDETAFSLADRQAKVGISLRKPVDLSELRGYFERLFPNPKIWFENIAVTLGLIREFYSVPAMSAGLFPGRPYPERMERLGKLLEHIPEGPISFRWMMMVGEKSSSGTCQS